MGKIKIMDYDVGCGGFSKGFVDTDKFKVVNNMWVNDQNSFTYQHLYPGIDFSDKEEENIDLFSFTPDVGHSFSRRGTKNFDFSPIQKLCKDIVSNKNILNAFIVLPNEAYPLYQDRSYFSYDSDGNPAIDFIIYYFRKNGYNIHHHVFDGADFGTPQHRFLNLYWISADIHEDINIYGEYGIHKKSYSSVCSFIKDITDETLLSWHNPNYKYKNECSLVKPGSNAKKTEDLNKNKGYLRFEGDKFSKSLDKKFYLTTSTGPCIQPYYDRPITIREGARLFGLGDEFDWESKISKSKVALMITESFTPIVSKKIAEDLLKFY